MIGSRLRAAPFLCPPLPLSVPGAPLQPRLSTAPSSRRVPSPKRHPHPPLQSPPLRHPFLPAGSHPHGASRTDLSRPRFVGTPSPGEASTLWRFPHQPLRHPFPWRGPNPAAPPAPTSPGPASPTPLLLAGPQPRDASRTSPSRPPPFHYPVLPVGPQPRGAFRTGLSRPPPRWRPFPRQGPIPKAPPTPPLPSPPFHHLISLARVSPHSTTHPPPILPLRHPLLPAGNTPKNSFHIVPPSPPSPLSKTDLGAAFPCLLAAPGRFWALFGLFRVLFGLFRVFFEKSWAKNFLFSPASGIIKPLTGTARR